MDLLPQVDLMLPADPDARGSPFSDTVHRQDQRFLERRRIESARGVALMVLGEQQLSLPIKVGCLRHEPLAKQVLLEQFLLDPQRQSHAKRSKPTRRE